MLASNAGNLCHPTQVMLATLLKHWTCLFADKLQRTSRYAIQVLFVLLHRSCTLLCNPISHAGYFTRCKAGVGSPEQKCPEHDDFPRTAVNVP